jgi:hypothetical protein
VMCMIWIETREIQVKPFLHGNAKHELRTPIAVCLADANGAFARVVYGMIRGGRNGPL